MFSFRYHIASLVAVFLALTVGLLLGSAISDQGSLARRQEGLLASIRGDIRRLSEKNRDLQTEVNQLRRFSEDVLRVAIRGRLSDSRVAIITFNSGDAGDLPDTLTKAGARVTHIDINLAKLDFSQGDLVKRLSEAMGGESTETSFEKLFWQRLAEGLTGPPNNALLGRLSDDGLISVDDMDALPVGKVVILAPADRSGNRDRVLMAALKARPGIIIVGAEGTKAEHSAMGAYQLTDVGTVDNVDSVPGKIALVYLLETGEKGKFGIKSSADRLLP